jgi:hypothetical protein
MRRKSSIKDTGQRLDGWETKGTESQRVQTCFLRISDKIRLLDIVVSACVHADLIAHSIAYTNVFPPARIGPLAAVRVFSRCASSQKQMYPRSSRTDCASSCRSGVSLSLGNPALEGKIERIRDIPEYPLKRSQIRCKLTRQSRRDSCR